MSHYRRAYIPGGTYFFTLVTYHGKPILCTNESLPRLRKAFQYTKKKYPFHIIGIVIMPDHLHCIWQLPENDSNYSIRWAMIKRYFSTGQAADINLRREKNIWQKRYWEHVIRNEDDLYKHLDYIYYNPVKHGYVNQPYAWPHSSFKRDVIRGFYTLDWGSKEQPKRIENLEFD